MSDVGTELKRARRAAGLSQTELGAAVGVSRDAISKWERGKVSEPRKLAEAQKYLGIDRALHAVADQPSTDDLTDGQLLALAQGHLVELANRYAARGDSAFEGIPITLTRVVKDEQRQQ